MSKDPESRALTLEEQEELRRHASKTLATLRAEFGQKAPSEMHDSWLNGTVPSSSDISGSCRFFDEFGFLHVSHFAGTYRDATIQRSRLIV